MIRANIEQDTETTMVKFLAELSRDIWDVVELQHYVELEDIVHLAMKVEKQLRRKDSTRHGSSLWRSNSGKMVDKVPPKPKVEKPRQEQLIHDKGLTSSKPQQSRDSSALGAQDQATLPLNIQIRGQ